MVCKDIACLLPIRNDSDIVYKHLVYYYNLGVRNFYALIHCGTEQDRSEIERFKKDSGSNVVILVDNNPEYNQDKNYMQLSEAASAHRWHVMSDTDELLILKEHKTIMDYLEDKEYDAINLKWHAYCNKTNKPMFEWEHRTTTGYDHKNKNGKAIMRYKQGLSWSWGHHYVTNAKTKLDEDDSVAFYGHFAFRSYEVFRQRKIDFADAKIKRFGNLECWVKQCYYDDISAGEKSIKKLYKRLKGYYYTQPCVIEPIPSELFVETF